MRPRSRRAALALALVVAGCTSDAAPLVFTVRAAPPDEPFRGADALVVALEREGVLVPGTERSFAVDASALALSELPFGEHLALRVEARLGGLVLARGRSFPFDYPREGAPPARDPDVWIGTLGRFGSTLPDALPGPALAVARTDEGALLATDRTVLVYRAHAAQGASTLEALVDVPAARAGASWVALGEHLVALGGAAPGLGVVGPEGTWLDVPLAHDVRAAGALSDRVVAWLADGTIVRLDVLAPSPTGTIVGRVAPPSGTPEVLGVPVRALDREVERALLLDDGRAVVVDPEGVEPPHEVSLAPARAGRIAAVVGTGLVVLAGGRDVAGDVSDEVALWVVRPERTSALERVSPTPPPLFTARAGAAVASLGPGRLVLAGGTGAAGEPLASAELIDVTALPGDVVATGAMPFTEARPVAALLLDRTVLVAGERGLASYFPPRGE